MTPPQGDRENTSHADGAATLTTQMGCLVAVRGRTMGLAATRRVSPHVRTNFASLAAASKRGLTIRIGH